MRIVYGLLGLVPAGLAVRFVVAGLHEWRGGGGTPLSRAGFLVDEQTRAGWDRSGLIMGLMCAFMALMLADGAVINLNDPVRAEALIFGAAALGLVACAGMYLSILLFSWPKFLVPPRHRGEPGALVAKRWRRGAGMRGNRPTLRS